MVLGQHERKEIAHFCFNASLKGMTNQQSFYQFQVSGGGWSLTIEPIANES